MFRVRMLVALLLLAAVPALGRADQFDKGLKAFKDGDYDLAISYLDDVIKEKPDFGRAYGVRGLAHMCKKDYDRACADFTRLIELPSKDADGAAMVAQGYLGRGVAFQALRQYDKALADFSQAIFLDPISYEAYANRGFIYIQKEQFDKARADCTSALSINPKWLPALFNRAAAYVGQKEFDKAIMDYNAALLLQPQNAPVYTARGAAHLGKKDYAQAAADFGKALAADPKDHMALSQFAWLLSTCPRDDLRDGKKAVLMANKACELTEWKEPRCLSTLAAAYAENGEFALAVDWQRKAMAAPDISADQREDGQKRLQLYEQKKPFRE